MQRWIAGLCQEKRCPVVTRDQIVPGLAIDFTETGRVETGSIVDQDMQAAESVAGLFGEIVYARVRREVSRDRQCRFITLLVEFIGERQRRCSGATIMDNEVCTILM